MPEDPKPCIPKGTLRAKALIGANTANPPQLREQGAPTNPQEGSGPAKQPAEVSRHLNEAIHTFSPHTRLIFPGQGVSTPKGPTTRSWYGTPKVEMGREGTPPQPNLPGSCSDLGPPSHTQTRRPTGQALRGTNGANITGPVSQPLSRTNN